MEERKEEGTEMDAGGTGVSRRSFLKGAAVGAAAVGVVAAVPYLLAPREEPLVVGEGSIAGAAGPVVVYVPDPTKGDVVIMRGEKEAVRKDTTLVSRVVADGER